MDNPGYIWIYPDKHVYTFGRAASGGREGDAHISYLAQSRDSCQPPVDHLSTSPVDLSSQGSADYDRTSLVLAASMSSRLPKPSWSWSAPAMAGAYSVSAWSSSQSHRHAVGGVAARGLRA